MINFDNTLQVKQFAQTQQAKDILNMVNIPTGRQTQLYNIGSKVNANGIDNAIITDTYKQNGYVYYVISWKHGKKVFTSNERQQDLILIEEV